MKKVLFVMSLFLTVTLQAQRADAIQEVSAIYQNEHKEQLKEKLNKLKQVEFELEALKKENQQLKTVIDKHRACLKGDYTTHNEAAGLNAGKVKRQPKKTKRKQNMLPPPL